MSLFNLLESYLFTINHLFIFANINENILHDQFHGTQSLFFMIIIIVIVVVVVVVVVVVIPIFIIIVIVIVIII